MACINFAVLQLARCDIVVGIGCCMCRCPQVHKARLMDGRQVAVKVQYPGLRGAANADLTTLSLLSAAAAALFPDFRLSWLYEELRLKLTEELGEWAEGIGD